MQCLLRKTHIMRNNIPIYKVVFKTSIVTLDIDRNTSQNRTPKSASCVFPSLQPQAGNPYTSWIPPAGSYPTTKFIGVRLDTRGRRVDRHNPPDFQLPNSTFLPRFGAEKGSKLLASRLTGIRREPHGISEPHGNSSVTFSLSEAWCTRARAA